MDRYLGTWAVASREAHRESAASYVVDVRPAFDALISVAAQMSAALVATTTGSRDSTIAGFILEAARGLFDEAMDMLRSIRVPPVGRHNHAHLGRAAALIGSALSLACESRSRRLNGDLDGIIARLRRGWGELNAASKSVPGLSVLNVSECCGACGIS